MPQVGSGKNSIPIPHFCRPFDVLMYCIVGKYGTVGTRELKLIGG